MSNKIKTILVDDEDSARLILANLLARVSDDIEIVAECSNLNEAVEAINQFKPDLLFLDIEMPKYAGYEITSFFDKINFEIIFVTAYDHYAVKAFEISAVDYLLKPIEVDRLKEALVKYNDKSSMAHSALSYKTMMEALESESLSKLIVPTKKGQKVLSLNDIICIEASRAYCTIYAADGQNYVLSKSLRHFESLLEENQNFIRCHKSWMINTQYLDTYSKTDLSIRLFNGLEVKLSKYKKAEFESLITL